MFNARDVREALLGNGTLHLSGVVDVCRNALVDVMAQRPLLDLLKLESLEKRTRETLQDVIVDFARKCDTRFIAMETGVNDARERAGSCAKVDGRW